MKLSQLLKEIEVTEMGADPELEFSGLCYDSRKVCPGDVFAAVKGFASDGHRFIPMAKDKGAAAVLCMEKPSVGVPYVLVPDSRLALALASRNYFDNPGGKLRLVGVTGTNGKTTVTHLLKQVLEKCRGEKVGLIGTTGILIGEEEIGSERTTPESFELQKLLRRMLDAGCSTVVMEVSSHAIALDRVAGLRYTVAAFTNLSQDHLDFHRTMEAYAEVKSRLFSRCDDAVLNADDSYYPLMAEKARCPVLTVSAKGDTAGLRASDVSLLPDRVRFAAHAGGEAAAVELGIPGRFSVYNALTVLGCGLKLGIGLEECAGALKTAAGVRGRVEPVPTEGDYTVLIDYAHTPDALENVLRAVRETTAGRVVVLFGCGGDRDRGKRPIMGRIGTELSDFAIITSDNPRSEPPEEIIKEIVAGVEAGPERYRVIPDRREAIAWAIKHRKSGDVIVLAGKGHETYQEIQGKKYPMDERKIVAEIREERKNP